MKVISAQFGEGTIITQGSKTVQVDFNGEIKNMYTRYAHLTLPNGSILKDPKKKKQVADPISDDLKNMSDSQLVSLHNSYMGELIAAKMEACLDGKTGTI